MCLLIDSGSENLPIHNCTNNEDDGNFQGQRHHCAFDNLHDDSEIYFDLNLPPLLRYEIVVDPDDEILDISDDANYQEDDHVDVPLEAEVEHDVGVIEGVGGDF